MFQILFDFMGACLLIQRGPVSRKPRKLFGRVKPLFSSSDSNKGEVYTPETSCMKGTSLYIKNMRIKQLCNRKARDFAMALVYGPEKFPGLSRNVPQVRNWFFQNSQISLVLE